WQLIGPDGGRAEVEVLPVHNHVEPPGLQRGELLLEHLDDKWRQAFRRLVEEQDLGVHHQRAGDGEHVLLAAAQRARPLVSPERRALTGAAPVSCSASTRGGCHRTWLRLSPRCHNRKSTRLNSSHGSISYAVFCLKKNK